MPKAMKKTDWAARAEAYTEAAGHLLLEWTDDPKEREQGNIVSRLLRREATKCQHIADTSPET